MTARCVCGVQLPDGARVDYCIHADPWAADNAGPELAARLLMDAVERVGGAR